MVNINIHLPTAPSSTDWIVALSIPLVDIQRLSLTPLNWLRFVIFAVSGAHGHLHATADPDGDIVDYSVAFTSLANNYYYFPEEVYRLIDHNALNDRITSSIFSERSSHFRDDVINRDGEICVITAEGRPHCDAAHIIPKSKGDEYIARVIEDRRCLYDEWDPDMNLNINSVENGILLRKDLHSAFGLGELAFLKTPNFALSCDDIPTVDTDVMSSDRITLQSLQPGTTLDPVPDRDVKMNGSRESPPPSLILDFMYGIAACKQWVTPEIQDMLKAHFQDHYQDIPILSSPLHSSGNNDNQSNEEYDLNDGTYLPSTSVYPVSKKHKSDFSDEMLKAMDTVNLLSMVLQGTTPQTLAAEQKRQEEVAESRAQEIGRLKAQKWLTQGHN